MFLLTVYRVLKFSLQNFFRNIWLSVVTVTIIVMSLFVMTMLISLNVLVQDTISNLQSKIDVSVYFKPEVSPSAVATIQTNLEQLNIVKQTFLINKETALENFKQRYEYNPVILRSLDALGINPLGDILLVKATHINYYDDILRVLQEEELQQYIQDSNFSDFKLIIDRISQVSIKINQIGVAVSLIFIAIAILVMFNTIRMAIYTHREEIAIMRLVGATSWFIRAPFILEGVFYALIAVIINILVLFPILDAVQPFMTGFFGPQTLNLTKYFQDNFFLIFGAEFLLIMLLNMISSWIAIRKYLKI